MPKRTILIMIILFNSLPLFSYPPGWEKVDVRPWKPSSYYLRIECADKDNCFIWANLHGSGGYFIRRTTDGGASWDNVYQDSSYIISGSDYRIVPELNDMSYPNEKLFIAVGDSGLVLRTTDKGETWENFRLDSNVSLFKLRMLNEYYGIMMSGEYPRPITVTHFLETSDGGETWKEMNYVDDDRINFVDVSLINRNQIAAIIWHRESEEWKDAKKKFLMVYNNWEYCDTLDISQLCRDFDFVDEKQGWIAGGYYSINDPTPDNYTQEIYYTSDGGKNWIEQRNRPYENDKGFTISGLDMYDEKFGIAESNQAMLLITTDGGKNWQENQLLPHKSNIIAVYDICAASPTTAYAILEGDTVYKYTREISDVNENNNMTNLHPNPATSQITLSLGEEFISEPEIDIIDYLGNAIKPEYEINGSEITINTSTLPPGVYFLRIRSGGQVETKKFVVVR